MHDRTRSRVLHVHLLVGFDPLLDCKSRECTFVEATEDQVVRHLDGHLQELPEEDGRSRAIIEQMREDEARHGDHAIEMGGEEFPKPVKAAMTLISKVMTETTYKV